MYVRHQYDYRKGSVKNLIITGPDGFEISWYQIGNYQVDEIVDELNRLRLEIVDLEEELRCWIDSEPTKEM